VQDAIETATVVTSTNARINLFIFVVFKYIRESLPVNLAIR
jgi:hypothetical protein